MDLEARPRCPHLPFEVWVRIIGFITDWRYVPRVWLNFRLVSHAFKEATEQAFAAVHLPLADINFGYIGVVNDDDDGQTYECDMYLKFDRLSGDGERAIFRSDVENSEFIKDITVNRGQPMFDYITQQFRAKLEPYLRPPPRTRFSHPPHVLMLRHEVADTPLPGAEADYEKRELSVLWRPMLSLFFGEVEFMKWASRVETQHSDARRRARGGGYLLRTGFFRLAISTSAKQSDDVRQTVRRLRFYRWYKKHGIDVNWNSIPDNPGRISTLRDASIMAGIPAPDEWDLEDPDVDHGKFYDGLGMTYKGMGENLDADDVDGADVDDEEDEEEGVGFGRYSGLDEAQAKFLFEYFGSVFGQEAARH